MKKLTPCKLKEIVKEEARSMLNEEGFENLPPGWDRDSLMSFARSLTGKTKADPEGFFTACMEEMEDKFDDPERFCASLKDEYLQTTDWRGKNEVNESSYYDGMRSKDRRSKTTAMGKVTNTHYPTADGRKVFAWNKRKKEIEKVDVEVAHNRDIYRNPTGRELDRYDEQKLRDVVREEIMLELGEPTKRQLGKVDRVEQTALTLSSPDAPREVGMGEFYTIGSEYRFSTRKYDKDFESLDGASRWLKTNSWEVTGEKRKR